MRHRLSGRKLNRTSAHRKAMFKNMAAVEKFLPPGYQTLGTVLNVTHFAATPVGLEVKAMAELVTVEGRKLTFSIKAKDEMETIGEGNHERVVVNVERFEQRVKNKIESAR